MMICKQRNTKSLSLSKTSDGRFNIIHSVRTAIKIQTHLWIVSVNTVKFSEELSFEVNNKMSDDDDLRRAEYQEPLSFQN